MKKFIIMLFVLSTVLFSKDITVSILPQKYFVEKIAGDKINVNVMVKPGFSPATYEPKTSQMKILSNSIAYLAIGVPFEQVWLDKFKNANNKMLIVDTSLGIKKLEMQEHVHHEENSHSKHDNEHSHHEHEKDNHEEHEHTGLDPHIWLDPMLVKVQAKNIYEALVKIDSSNKQFYLNNYKAFVSELEELNKKLESIIEPYEHKAFMVFHPSWGYFAKRYHLEQISIEILGKEPKPAQLVELISEAKEHNIKIVFVAPQFSTKGAKTIASSIKGNTAVIDPLSYEWKENLLKVANEIAKSYK